LAHCKLEALERRHLPYTPSQLFDLVADVERYPDFVPWILFGVASVAVATPLVATIRHAVLRLQHFSSAAIDELATQ
jgi:ribosome-associated toxin RatA of RatAB toxin-antitoxin module